MSKKSKAYKSIKFSKEKNKKIGIKSITDIINNVNNLSYQAKIDYIRHKYTYYDGNEMLFFDKENNPLILRNELNTLIEKIIKKEEDPAKLKKFNRKILRLRKEYDSKNINDKIINFEIKSNDIKEKFKECNCIWLNDIKNNKDNASFYLAVINKYLNESTNKPKNEILNKMHYKEIKALANKWFKSFILNNKDNTFDFKPIYQSIDNNKKTHKLLILRGIPGSGKSTFCKNELFKDATIISQDDIRISINGIKKDKNNIEYIPQDNKDKVLWKSISLLKKSLEKNNLTIYDSTNIRKQKIKKLIKEAIGVSAEYRIIDFSDQSLEECIERNKNRLPVYTRVNSDVLTLMYNSLKRSNEYSDTYESYMINHMDIKKIKCFLEDY